MEVGKERERERDRQKENQKEKERWRKRSQREDGVIQKREIDEERQMALGERCFKDRRDRAQEAGGSEILRDK